MSVRIPRLARAILRFASGIVPHYRRAAWRRQWVAELEHRGAVGAADGAVRFALGSFAHALYLRKEELRMAGWIEDLGHSARALARRPGFSALSVATLAVGIGAATAVFSLAETLLLRPLALERADRLVRIFSTNARMRGDRFSVSYPDYADFTGRSDLFEQASLYFERSQDVSGGGDPERIRVTTVHQGFFETLRSTAHVGRLLGADDHDPRGPPTAVLAESFWTRRYGADSSVVGGTIRLDGVPHTVVGVVSDALGWPAGSQVWTPLRWGRVVPEHAARRSNHTWQVVARLSDGVDVRSADAQVRSMAQTIYAGPDVEERERATEAVVVPLRGSEGEQATGQLFATLGLAVFLVLLIACMNVSGLLLTRAWARGRELSLRAALGAGRGRLIAILLGESAVLALLGGAVGLTLGHVALTRAFALAPADLTRLGEVRMNGTVLLAGIGVSVFAAVLAGSIPALRASRTSLASALREGGTGQAGTGWGGSRLRRALVVSELALSFALLVCAGLVVRGFQRQIASDPGFEASRMISFTVRLPSSRYGEPSLVRAYFADAIDRLERHPAILGASSASRLPLDAGGLSLGRSFIFDGAAPPPEGVEFPASWIEVDPGYFRTLGVEPTRGRAFTAGDDAEAPPVAIVNERMARLMSPGAPIVGRAIRSLYDENVARTVVGVVPDIQFNGLSREQREPLVLVPRAQSVRTSMGLLVRVSGDPSEMIPEVRRTMAELDPDVALDGIQPLRDAHAADLAGIRFLTVLFATFGLLALVLAVSGVYGLVSYTVSQRTQEIGVRVAMGATRGGVRTGVIVESATLAALGLAIGLALAYGLGRLLSYGMGGVAVLEPSTFVAVAVVLGAAAVAASWAPATRATRVDPVRALRAE